MIQHPVYRFIGLVLLLLPFTYLGWYLLAPWLVAPLTLPTDWLLRTTLPAIVHSVQIDGAELMMQTRYDELEGRLVSARATGFRLAFGYDCRILTAALPLYAALTFATRYEDRVNTFFRGLLMMYPILLVSLLVILLQQLVVGLGNNLPPPGSTWDPNRDLMALGFQFASLVVPPLLPILTWAWQAREQLQQLFPAALSRPAAD